MDFFVCLSNCFLYCQLEREASSRTCVGLNLIVGTPRASLSLVVDNWGRYSHFEVKPVPLLAGIFVDKNLIEI